MESSQTRKRPILFLAILLFLQLVTYATVLFDILVARPVVGFIYFTFVPGFVILKLLKLDELNRVETVLFSIGFSIAFLMLAGVLINELSLTFRISKPLSEMPLLVIMNTLVLICGIVVYLRNEHVSLSSITLKKPSPVTLLLIGLPVLSIVGAMWINIYGSNQILLAMVIAIAVALSASVLSKKPSVSNLYPLAIIMIALALLFHTSMISNYIVSQGSDVNLEYFVSKKTENRAYWSSTPTVYWETGFGRIYSMLSVTILPTIYSALLNIDQTWIFKMLFPVIFSFVPLGLYQVWQPYLGKKYAIMATFLFMAESTFFTEMLGLNRQIIGELFFVLLLFVVLNKKMKPINRLLSFLVFSIAVVVAHYALAEIFLFFISFALIYLFVLKRPSRNITASMAVLFFTIMFTWYIYTTNSAVFDSFVSFGNYVYNQLGNFLDPASRGRSVVDILSAPPTVFNYISRISLYATQVLIVLGFISVILKRVEIHFERNYVILSSAAFALLSALIIVPGLANTLNMTRFYHILLFFLAPFSVVGAVAFTKLVSKREREIGASLLMLAVLVPYFLFQTGFVYEVTQSKSWSVPLSMYRMDPISLYQSMGYINTQDVISANWISAQAKIDAHTTQVIADIPSISNILMSHALFYSGDVNVLSNTTVTATSATIYLSWLNIVKGKVVGTYHGSPHAWNISDISPILDDMNRIYSNGADEIYHK